VPNAGKNMAIEKLKKYVPIIDEPLDRHKGHRDRHPMACSDQRRQWDHCGICGYGETVYQGVDYCTVCGNEQEVLSLDDWPRKDKLKCCYSTESYRHFKTGKMIEYQKDAVERYTIEVCLACGAVKAPSCPNCHRPCWKKDLKRYCHFCGFRTP
jgi:hypothetical protein